jgi:hypothetical protein
MANSGVPLVVRRWDTVVYPPDGTPVTSSGVEWSSPATDPLSLSYPSLLPSQQQQQHHHSATIPTRPAILHGAGGYSSQPMSRDGSNRSLNPSINITNSPELQVVESPPSGGAPSPSPLLARGGAHGRSTSPLGARGRGAGRALPIPGSSPISPISRLSPFNSGRPPSYTETEPSPRLDTPFSDADPREYHQPHHPMGAAVVTGTSLPPGVGTNNNNDGSSSGGGQQRRGSSSSHSSLGARWRASSAGRNRIFRVGSGSSSRKRDKGGKARAQSLSPRAASPPSAGSGAGSPLLSSISPSGSGSGSSPSSSAAVRRRAGSPSQGQLRHSVQHPLAAAWSTPPVEANVHSPPSVGIMMEGPDTATSMGGGEAMSRSASAGSAGGAAAGGIRMGDGTVVEFGSPGLGSGGSAGARTTGNNRTRSGSSPPEMVGMTTGLGVWSEETHIP